jgi:hypothetical protein
MPSTHSPPTAHLTPTTTHLAPNHNLHFFGHTLFHALSAPTRHITPRRTRCLQHNPSACLPRTSSLLHALLYALPGAPAPLYTWHTRPFLSRTSPRTSSHPQTPHRMSCLSPWHDAPSTRFLQCTTQLRPSPCSLSCTFALPNFQPKQENPQTQHRQSHSIKNSLRSLWDRGGYVPKSQRPRG